LGASWGEEIHEELDMLTKYWVSIFDPRLLYLFSVPNTRNSKPIYGCNFQLSGFNVHMYIYIDAFIGKGASKGDGMSKYMHTISFLGISITLYGAERF
jgi:hypothetical protein